jgi:thiol:disulfide interchange protein
MLKLKADNNPWNCDCDMKDLFDIIYKSVLTLPNLTCKGPSEYENKHWEVLTDVDCSTTLAPTVIRTTEKSVSVSMASSSDRKSAIPKTEKSISVSVTSSSDRKSAIPEDTEKPATNNDGPLKDTLETVLKVNIISLIVLVLIFLFLIFMSCFLCMCGLKRYRVLRSLLGNQGRETNAHEILLTERVT